MKILQVVWNFPDTVMRPFDMYYFYWPMREALERGWEAEVLTFQVHEKQPAEEMIDGIRVRRCPAGMRKGRPFSWSFIHALLTTDADIIYCHGYGEGRSELAILLGRLRRRKVVFTPHFHIYPYKRRLREFYDKFFGRFFFTLSDRVIVFTRFTYQHLRSLQVPASRVRIVSHVARPEVFSTQPNGSAPEEQLRREGVSGQPLILGVGQLIERKGWEYSVRCLPALVERFPEVKLLIVGPSKPAEPLFRQRLLHLASELNVAEHIQILQDNPPDFIRSAYQAATVVTHPSFVESFGMVLLEALAAGVPIVSHNGTGLPCILDDGITGYVVDVRDTAAYTEALLSLLEQPELRQRMGTEGKRQAATRFAQAVIADQLFSIFAELVGEKAVLLEKTHMEPRAPISLE